MLTGINSFKITNCQEYSFLKKKCYFCISIRITQYLTFVVKRAVAALSVPSLLHHLLIRKKCAVLI